jgi:hypothetical protein
MKCRGGWQTTAKKPLWVGRLNTHKTFLLIYSAKRYFQDADRGQSAHLSPQSIARVEIDSHMDGATKTKAPRVERNNKNVFTNALSVAILLLYCIMRPEASSQANTDRCLVKVKYQS